MILLRHDRPACICCGRTKSFALKFTSTATGRSAWLCWRHLGRLAAVLP